MPALGYAYAINPQIINKSRKRCIFLNAQDYTFVQCVSPSYINLLQMGQSKVKLNILTQGKNKWRPKTLPPPQVLMRNLS